MERIGRLTPATAEVLAELLSSDKPVWGLQIIKSTGRKAGTIYPILDRLEALGWVTSEWEDDGARKGPRRRYYKLNSVAAMAANSYVSDYLLKVSSKPASALAVHQGT